MGHKATVVLSGICHATPNDAYIIERAPLVTNMDEGEGGEANGSGPPMSLRRLLVGIFWNPIGIQFGIAIIAVSIGFILKLVGWL